MSLYVIFLLLALGLITGFYSGLLGTGGNVLLIPALDALFFSYHIPPDEAVRYIIAHSLFITIFLGASVSYTQYRMGNFYPKEVLHTGIPGMLSAYGFTEWIKATSWYDKSYFDLIFLSLLLALALRILLAKPRSVTYPEDSRKRSPNVPYSFWGLGLLTGAVTSLSGMGGGIVLIPFLTDIQGYPIKRASSTSIGVIMLLAVAVSLSYMASPVAEHFAPRLPYQVGYISWLLVLPILVGIFLASSYGVKAAQSMAPARLRLIFGLVITALSARMLWMMLS